jgi:nucleotide-binding universal stress UspA family protein
MMAEEGIHALKVLLADDGSQHSQAASELVGNLPLPPGSTVTVVGVLTPRDSSEHEYRHTSLAKKRSFFESKGFETTYELLVGQPAETLVDYTERHQPDLIVMGAKGLRATFGILLGGVAQQVVEYAKRPVLIVRAPYTGISRVLLITDGSNFSRQAVRYLGNFPLPEGVETRLVHVLPPAPSPELYMRSWPVGAEPLPPLMPPSNGEMAVRRMEEERVGKVLLDQTSDELETMGLKVMPVLLRGDAATELLTYARAHQIDLIVAGSRGLSPVKSWLLGSLSRKLVHYAPCSVLVIRGS